MPTRYEVSQQILNTDWAGKRFLGTVDVPHGFVPLLGRDVPSVVAVLVDPRPAGESKTTHQARNGTSKIQRKDEHVEKNKRAPRPGSTHERPVEG